MSEQIDLEEAIAKAPPRKHARWWPRHKFAEIDIGDGSRLRGDFVSSHRGELVRRQERGLGFEHARRDRDSPIGPKRDGVQFEIVAGQDEQGNPPRTGAARLGERDLRFIAGAQRGEALLLRRCEHRKRPDIGPPT